MNRRSFLGFLGWAAAGVAAFPKKLAAIVMGTTSPHRQTLEPYPITVRHPFVGLVYGPPASGKTSFLLRSGESSRSGSAVYFSFQDGPSLKLHFQRIGIRPSANFYIASMGTDAATVEKIIEEYDIRLLLLDTSLPDKEILDRILPYCRNRGVSILLVAYPKKNGSLGWPKDGVAALSHAADLIIRVNGMKWQVEKSRFGGPASGCVL